MLLKYLGLHRVLVPLGGPGHPAKRSTVGRTERGLGLSWWVLLPWTHPRTEAREDKVQRQEEPCVPPCSASGPSSRTGVEGEWVWEPPAEPSLARGRAMVGGGLLWARAGGLGLADGVGGLTYVHTLLLRTSGGPHCSRSRGPGGGRRPQLLCNCPPAAGHTPYNTHSRP